jgi:hypothetical protein
MKRLLSKITAIAAAVLMTAAAFTACDKIGLTNGEMLSDTPFSARMEFDTEKVDFIADVSRLGMGMWEMTVLEPQNLAGLKISYDGENVTTILDGHTETQAVENISDNAIFLQLFRVFDNAVSLTDQKIRTENGNTVLTGSINTSPYEIIFSSETKLPIEIKLPASEIEAYISEFQVD